MKKQNTRTRLTIMLKKAVLALAALTLATSASLAVTDVYLVAKEFTQSIDPDGAGPLPAEAITMWGFALDVDGDLATDGGEVATSPGPAITVPAADAELRIFLRNDLAVPVSVVIPGQELPWSDANNGPTWNDGMTVGARPNPNARVRSFGREAAAGGGQMSYQWTAAHGNPIQAGTYLYQSGTHPALQVQMGLYGAVTQDAAVGFAYPGVAYDGEVVLLYSEIDPALHDPPTAANPSNYHPRYFLINGELFDPADAGSQRYAGLVTGTDTLVRFLNAGLTTRTPTLTEGYLTVVAEDGKPYPYAREQYSTLLAAGKTADAVLQKDQPGSYPLFDRRLALTNGPGLPGGLVGYLEFSAAP
jgi:FtsP/CotA-like multicopper oxidase with cupredoxin domain